VVDPRDGVVIGIHASRPLLEFGRCSGNAMLPMSEWLQRTLRSEIDKGKENELPAT
jgi:hypothetical protein